MRFVNFQVSLAHRFYCIPVPMRRRNPHFSCREIHNNILLQKCFGRYGRDMSGVRLAGTAKISSRVQNLMSGKFALSLIAVAFAAGIVVAQQDGLLQPTMEPTGGWASSGSMGKTGDWTATTVAAGVAQKPLAGKPATVVGEVIDLSCYLQLGKHGAAHAACGGKCITAGEPIGILTKAGDVYLAMAEEHDPRRDAKTTFRKAAADNFAKVITVTGTQTTVNGIKTIYVQGFTTP
jgi:hypothetical protein